MDIVKRELIVFFAIFVGLIGISCSRERDEPEYDYSFDKTDQSTETPSDNSKDDSKIKSLIDQCVSVNAQYVDYMWYFTIESTLHHELPGRKIEYGIGHGDINGKESVSVGDQAYKYSSIDNGRKKIINFTIPFWFYYIFGIEPYDEKAWTRCEMYYASYIFLKDKGLNSLSKDEQDLYRSLQQELNDYENEARLFYKPAVEICVDSKFYLKARYRMK